MFQLGVLGDFFLAFFGLTHYLWNPLLFAAFDLKFRRCAVVFIREEILCRRSARPQPCCPSSSGTPAKKVFHKHDQPWNPMRRHSTTPKSASGILALVATTMPERSRINNIPAKESTAGVDEDGAEVCDFTPQIMYPLPPKGDPEAAARTKKKVNEDLRREQYWGEILEKSVSYASIHQLSSMSPRYYCDEHDDNTEAEHDGYRYCDDEYEQEEETYPAYYYKYGRGNFACGSLDRGRRYY